MKIALCQINPTIGDLRGNSRMIVDAAVEAGVRGADLAVYPELAVTGYPPLDLLDDSSFLDAVELALSSIARSAPPDIDLLIGAPVRNRGTTGKRLRNAALLVSRGEIVDQIDKSLLPTYDVYDEYRHFEPASRRRCMLWRGLRLGVHVCEDMWNSDAAADFRMYDADPIADLASDGADLFINLSATPYSLGSPARRRAIVEQICTRFGCPFVIVSQVGANTELIFDGSSGVHRSDGRVVLRAPAFKEATLIWDTDDRNALDAGNLGVEIEVDEIAELHRALVLGIRDFFRKSEGFTLAVVGLSGGIDSSVTCALAIEALSASAVLGVSMPSRYTSSASIEDARLLAATLGIKLSEVPIEPAVEAFCEMLPDFFDDPAAAVTAENIQARVRAVALMAFCNRLDGLLLGTGNKSETAVGYTTLYGDMAGGLGVLQDVYKTQVYALARFINSRASHPIIPERVLQRAPSAELRPGQVDQDALPPYEQLDAILRLYIEEQHGLDAIVARTGFNAALVTGVLRLVDRHEFKRRQAPPGLRVSKKAFGSGRLLPVTAGWDRSLSEDSRLAPHALRGGK